MPLFLKWKNFFKGGGKGSLRSYYIIAGTYLVVVVVVFSVLVLRWGTTPQLDLPGYEGREQIIGEDHPAMESPIAPHSGEVETTDPATPSGDTANQIPGDASGMDEGVTPIFPRDNGDAGYDSNEQEELSELPAAANPLPQWELALPFGDYLTTSLPSGGAMHHLSRGVLLRTTPAAPVSAIWDGVVTKVMIKDGLYRSSVLIEHTDHIGEYSTFYGNMREIWVTEGAVVSRGENIGLMGYTVNGRGQSEHESSLPVSGPGPAAVGTDGQSLKIRTIWSGYITDSSQMEEESVSDLEESVPALLPTGEREGLPLDNPLFYLEIREGGTYLDPLNFIAERN